uniref:Uncharacterized protein n=1 Tax=Sphaerodactylus townsendi TaxID=933632 RepID=A0ACB8FK94_9SAUR
MEKKNTYIFLAAGETSHKKCGVKQLIDCLERGKTGSSFYEGYRKLDNAACAQNPHTWLQSGLSSINTCLCRVLALLNQTTMCVSIRKPQYNSDKVLLSTEIYSRCLIWLLDQSKGAFGLEIFQSNSTFLNELPLIPSSVDFTRNPSL